MSSVDGGNGSTERLSMPTAHRGRNCGEFKAVSKKQCARRDHSPGTIDIDHAMSD
jgi:hypothetical protein